MLYSVTYTTRNGEKLLECGQNPKKAAEVFLRENRKTREVILWEKTTKNPTIRSKTKSARVLSRKTILAISEIGTLEITEKKELPKQIVETPERETPKPTRKPAKKENKVQDLFDLFRKVAKAKETKTPTELNLESFLSRASKPKPPKPSKPKTYNRTMGEMNVGDIFIRWDGEEFVKIGKTLIENTETGELENCELSCKGKVVGNRFGEIRQTIAQENRQYSTAKKQKPSALPHVGEKTVKVSEQKFVEVKDKDGNIVEVPIEKFFSRKAR